MLTRRRFALSATAMVLLPAVAGVAPVSAMSVAGVRVGITSNAFSPLPEIEDDIPRLSAIIDLAQAQGLDLIELSGHAFGPWYVGLPGSDEYAVSRERLRQWRLSGEALEQARAVKALFEQRNMTLFSMSSAFQLDISDEEIAAVFGIIDAAGVKLFHTGTTRMRVIPRIVPLLDSFDMRMAAHPHGGTSEAEVGSWASLEKILEMSPQTCVCLDLGHFTAANEDPLAFLAKYPERITHLHVKDRRRDDGPNVALGEGDTPIVECLRLIRDNSWPIPVLLEREFDSGEDPVAQVGQQLAYVRAALEG